MADCTISGTLKDAHNQAVKNAVLKITPLSVTGVLMSSVAREVRSDSSGAYSFILIQGGSYNIAGRGILNFEEEDGGTDVTIPSSATATLESLQSVALTPATGLTLKDEGTALASLIGTINVTGAGASVVQASAGVATLNIPGFAELCVAASDETTNLTTGTAKVTFRMPFAMTVTGVRASVNTAPTGSALVVDINDGGTSILSTKLSIDAGEKTSQTAATPPVISDSALADDAEITIDIDQIGSTVAGKGLKVWIIGTRV